MRTAPQRHDTDTTGPGQQQPYTGWLWHRARTSQHEEGIGRRGYDLHGKRVAQYIERLGRCLHRVGERTGVPVQWPRADVLIEIIVIEGVDAG